MKEIMPKLQERKIKKYGIESSSFLITLPRDYINIMSWKKGNHIIVRMSDDKKLMTLEKA